MAIADYSTTPAYNITISGINIAEGCPAGNTNDAIRQLMADIRVLYNNQSNTAGYVLKTGGSFTGNPVFSGRGGYLHFNDAANTSGRVFVQPAGNPPPAMSNGDWLLEYA